MAEIVVTKRERMLKSRKRYRELVGGRFSSMLFAEKGKRGRRWTQRKLASKLGIDEPKLSGYILCKHLPHMDEFARIVDELGWSEEDVLLILGLRDPMSEAQIIKSRVRNRRRRPIKV